MTELEIALKKLFNAERGKTVKVQVNNQLKQEIKALELISAIMEKLTPQELIEIYEQKGGKKEDLEKRI